MVLDGRTQEENRPFSNSVKKQIDDGSMRKELARCFDHYVKRLGGYFQKATFIGTEVPCRMTYSVGDDMKPITLATHMDLLFRDEHGELICWDWKYRKESPSMMKLGRDFQFVLMFLCILEGVCCVDEALDYWCEFKEPARMGWVDLINFKPYHRRTETKDRVFVKGDDRPMANIIREWSYDDTVDRMKAEIAEKVVLWRAGVFPMTPGDHCQFCDALRFCKPFHKDI